MLSKRTGKIFFLNDLSKTLIFANFEIINHPCHHYQTSQHVFGSDQPLYETRVLICYQAMSLILFVFNICIGAVIPEVEEVVILDRAVCNVNISSILFIFIT
tara:strand:- start:330 stop:635 length:306 start_codon:yes stop_codon:yes gene_type:complete